MNMDVYDLSKTKPKGDKQSNVSVISSENEEGINIFPGPDGFTGRFSQTFRELTPILPKLFHDTGKKGTPLNSFYKTSISLISKLDRDTTKKKTISQSS